MLNKDNKPIVIAHRYISPRVGQKLNEYDQAINYMARALLIPLEEFKWYYIRAKRQKTPFDMFVKLMSDYYGVSNSLIRMRMEDTETLLGY